MLARQLALFFSLLLNAVLLYSLIWGGKGILAYQQLKGLSEKLAGQILTLDEQNIVLSQEIRLLQSDEKYIEKIVRNRLNYVKDSEILYIFPDNKQVDTPGAAADETKD